MERNPTVAVGPLYLEVGVQFDEADTLIVLLPPGGAARHEPPGRVGPDLGHLAQPVQRQQGLLHQSARQVLQRLR